MFSSAKTQIPTALQAFINKQISVFQILYNIKVLKICILLFIIFNAKLEAFKCQYTHPRVGIASFPLLLNYFRAICDTDFFFPLSHITKPVYHCWTTGLKYFKTNNTMLAENKVRISSAASLSPSGTWPTRGWGTTHKKEPGPVSFKDLFTWDFIDNVHFRDTGIKTKLKFLN